MIILLAGCGVVGLLGEKQWGSGPERSAFKNIPGCSGRGRDTCGMLPGDHHLLPTAREECAYLRVSEFLVDMTITSSRTQRSSLHSSPSDPIFTHFDRNWVTEVPSMSDTCRKVWSPPWLQLWWWWQHKLSQWLWLLLQGLQGQ